MKTIKESLINKIKDRVGNKKAIVGVSGGVDSAVVASLCVKALGKDNVFIIVLPYNNQNTKDAYQFTFNLDITIFVISITELVDIHMKNLYGECYESFHKQCYEAPKNINIVKGNIMARERMIILYAYANMFDGYVMGTGNKSELELGYSTKYGDGGVDFEVLGNLFKSEVYQLAKELKNIPQQIIDAKPSAELWEGQTDEEEMGISYDDIELVLKNKLSNDDSRVKLVRKLQNKSLHKQYIPEKF